MNSQYTTVLLFAAVLLGIFHMPYCCSGQDEEASPLLLRFRRGAAYSGGYSSRPAPKLTVFEALGAYGGFDRNGHRPHKISVAGALGAYGGFLGHKGSGSGHSSSGGYGQGGGSGSSKGY